MDAAWSDSRESTHEPQPVNSSLQAIEDITLDAGQTRTLTLQMDLLGVSTQIEVTAAGSGLSQSSAEIGGVVHGAQAQELPLNFGLITSSFNNQPVGTGTPRELQSCFAPTSNRNPHALSDGHSRED